MARTRIIASFTLSCSAAWDRPQHGRSWAGQHCAGSESRPVELMLHTVEGTAKRTAMPSAAGLHPHGTNRATMRRDAAQKRKTVTALDAPESSNRAMAGEPDGSIAE